MKLWKFKTAMKCHGVWDLQLPLEPPPKPKHMQWKRYWRLWDDLLDEANLYWREAARY